jgi:adenylate cyclase
MPLDGDFLNPAMVERAYQSTRKAVQLDPTSPQAHADMGDMLTWKNEHDAAIAAFDRAIAFNPNFSDGRFALALVFAGQPERAMQVAEAHTRVDPFHPPPVTAFSGPAHYMLKDYPEAMRRLREHLARRPDNRPAHTWLAATYARMGRMDDARKEVAEVLRLMPGYTIEGVAKYLICFKRPQDTEHVLDGLRLAGMPER